MKPTTSDPQASLEVLTPSEKRWASYQPWLQSLGYDLRRRYQPGWKPSWHKTGLDPYDSEDSILPHIRGSILDATRRKDKRIVVMKLVPTNKQELAIWRCLSAPALLSDPRNSCVPLLDVLVLPDTDEELLAVMPLLLPFNRVRFETPGEIMQCLYKLSEGLVFLHEQNVAHLDICVQNTMMDPGDKLYPKGFHPAHPSGYTPSSKSPRIKSPPPRTCRTLAPVEYHYIDFGESVRFNSFEERELITGSVGHYLDIPDFADGKPYDPFRVDIHAFGDMIKETILDAYSGLTSLEPLVNALRESDPEKRPTAAEALQTLKSIIASQSAEFLTSHVPLKSDFQIPRRDYLLHRYQARVLRRPPIYPEIPGVDFETPKPMNLFSRIWGRISVFFADEPEL
ncbi:hypothetical protein SISNIDRAFT_431678 [Sistotremastrum niveocremeum HHB9708]|uniref:Protein kinase domain-containing protein n=2 Tax=Sistotremastraceae TaxID=3402574 RepID=A0A164QNR5_9AGAM|nr:hypothetical protein SISNIDRAFT_431678 [Sistotremastrum niveocremeum HHB9708]KZT41083.1 hypothetical protein SISSUDRAFT_1018150 [Sistotremastrum suecicum HHB10207 ss-3]